MNFINIIKNTLKLSIKSDKKICDKFTKEVSIQKTSIYLISVFAFLGLIMTLALSLSGELINSEFNIEFSFGLKLAYFIFTTLISLIFVSGWNFINYITFKFFGAKGEFDNFFKFELNRTLFTIFFLIIWNFVVYLTALINIKTAQIINWILVLGYFVWIINFNINSYSSLYKFSKLKTFGIIILPILIIILAILLLIIFPPTIIAPSNLMM